MRAQRQRTREKITHDAENEVGEQILEHVGAQATHSLVCMDSNERIITIGHDTKMNVGGPIELRDRAYRVFQCRTPQGDMSGQGAQSRWNGPLAEAGAFVF